MIFLVDGQPKSGSTFLFRLITSIMHPELSADFLHSSSGRLVFHTRHEKNTEEAVPFIKNPGEFVAEANSNEIWRSELQTKNAVLKLHYGRWLPIDGNRFSIIHFLTYRNILDSALAMLNQAKREGDRPKNRQRPAFLALNDPAIALKKALDDFQNIVIPALADARIICLPYPNFIQAKPDCCIRISQACDIPVASIAAQIDQLDRDVRAGLTKAQFGKGVPGLGVAEKHIFPKDLTAKSEEINEKYKL